MIAKSKSSAPGPYVHQQFGLPLRIAGNLHLCTKHSPTQQRSQLQSSHRLQSFANALLCLNIIILSKAITFLLTWLETVVEYSLLAIFRRRATFERFQRKTHPCPYGKIVVGLLGIARANCLDFTHVFGLDLGRGLRTFLIRRHYVGVEDWE